MFSALSAETLLGRTRLPVTLLRPNGDILYQNAQASDLLARPSGSESVLSCLASPSQWEDILGKVAAGEPICDEPVLILAGHNETEVSYLTAIPQYNPAGDLDSLVCAWASRRNVFNSLACDRSEETVSEYTRDLEALLEHRTYQQLLAAEQNEFCRQILDILPAGILVADGTGNIVYRNQALCEQYGFRHFDSLHAHVRHVLDAAAFARFEDVCLTGRRDFVDTIDPAGRAAELEILPIVSRGKVERVVLLYSRITVPTSFDQI